MAKNPQHGRGVKKECIDCGRIIHRAWHYRCYPCYQKWHNKKQIEALRNTTSSVF